MLNVNLVSFHANKFGIKYLNIYDEVLDGRRGFPAFLDRDPRYIVYVEVNWREGTPVKDIQESDIFIAYSDANELNFCTTVFEDQDNVDKVLDICRNEDSSEFLVDLKSMDVIRRNMFTSRFPNFGLNTLLIFPRVKEEKVYSVVNSMSTVVKNSQIFSYLLAYIYSANICLRPLSDFAYTEGKIMLQVLASSEFYGNLNLDILDPRYSTAAKMVSSEELSYDGFAKTSRLSELYEQTVEQLKSEKQKGNSK